MLCVIGHAYAIKMTAAALIPYVTVIILQGSFGDYYGNPKGKRL